MAISTARIRFVREDDAAQIAAIYGPYCEHSVANFELRAPTVEEILAKIRRISPIFPWIVMEIEGRVAGYSYASPHRGFGSYIWSVESSVYVAEGHQRKGVARAMYTSLFELLRGLGYFNVFAGLGIPNAPSAALHEAMGFEQRAAYKRVGYKLGAWRDTAWYELFLRDGADDPPDPIEMSAALGAPWVGKAFTAGLAELRSD